MRDEAALWLQYAEESLESARIILDHHLYGVCLQNIQQAVEKFLKAILIEKSIPFPKTHSIGELFSLLLKHNVRVDISEDECELFDSIYLPARYPLGSVLPKFSPDADICRRCIAVADRVKKNIR